MLLIKTIVKESTIPGIGFGLFTDEDIPVNKVIWKFNPLIDKVIDVKDVENFEDVEKEYLRIYAYREGTKLILCADNDRFINHSKELLNVQDLIYPILGSISVATRDIKKGEELFCDYSSFHDDYKDFNKLLNYK